MHTNSNNFLKKIWVYEFLGIFTAGPPGCCREWSEWDMYIAREEKPLHSGWIQVAYVLHKRLHKFLFVIIIIYVVRRIEYCKNSQRNSAGWIYGQQTHIRNICNNELWIHYFSQVPNNWRDALDGAPALDRRWSTSSYPFR